MVSEWTVYIINPTTSQMYTVFRQAFCYRNIKGQYPQGGFTVN